MQWRYVGYWLVSSFIACNSTFAQDNSQQGQPSWKRDFWLASQNSQQKVLSWQFGNQGSMPQHVPLGSLWKLFIYSYSIDQALPDRLYQCQAGKNAAIGDEYCCSKSEAIGRDVALARSCGAYFSPKRLQLSADDWQRYWQQKAPDVKWLHTLTNMQPQTQVSVQDILTALNGMSPNSIMHSRQALLGRLLQPQWSAILPPLGGAYRFKTFTWRHPQYSGAYFGGAAGWLANGTAFWLGGAGSSRDVLMRALPILAQSLPTSMNYHNAFDDECVVVHYFKRYPIQNIHRLGDSNQAISSGRLRGQYVVAFTNNNHINIESNGELSLENNHGVMQLWGKLELQEYLARVIDREADAKITEAAKALSIAARSYLYQNAQFHQGCWQIDDDSRTQRVSPMPPTVKAKSVVAFTEGLSLTGSPIYFHQNKNSTNVLSWKTAANHAAQGSNYLALLHDAYPNASWRLSNSAEQCQHLTSAENYVKNNLTQVHRLLNGVNGLEPVKGFKVCRLDYGNPYADQQSMSVYVRDWRNENDRITLWHEYLHLALRYHPNGVNEAYIEKISRQLAQSLSLNTSTTEITPVNAYHLPAKRIHNAQ